MLALLQVSSPVPANLMVPDTMVSLVKRAVPLTSRVLPGDVVPMPTFPKLWQLLELDRPVSSVEPNGEF